MKILLLIITLLSSVVFAADPKLLNESEGLQMYGDDSPSNIPQGTEFSFNKVHIPANEKQISLSKTDEEGQSCMIGSDKDNGRARQFSKSYLVTGVRKVTNDITDTDGMNNYARIDFAGSSGPFYLKCSHSTIAEMIKYLKAKGITIRFPRAIEGRLVTPREGNSDSSK